MKQNDEQRRGLSDTARANMRAWRTELGMSAEELARRITESGVPMARNVVVNLERGKRNEISLEELAAIALALDVSPADLVLPPDDADGGAWVTPSVRGLPGQVRAWWSGERPLSQDPDDDGFYRHAPTRVRDRHVRLRGNPAVEQLESLSGLVEDALTRARSTAGYSPATIAAALRRDLDRVNRHVELLAEQLESEADRG